MHVPRCIARCIVSAAFLGIVVSALAQAQPGKPAEASRLAGIAVLYKVDPRLSGPTYGGERWVAGPKYAGTNAQDMVEAKVQGIDASGRPVDIIPDWTPSDPDMVSVSPSRGKQVKITVKRAGESTVRISAGAVSRDLVVKAEYSNNFIQVAITELPSTAGATAAVNTQLENHQ